MTTSTDTAVHADVVVIGSGGIGPGYNHVLAAVDTHPGGLILEPEIVTAEPDPLGAAAAALARQLAKHRRTERRFDLVAAGWGATVALRMAADHPDLVRRLSLAAPSCAGRSVMAQPAVPLRALLQAGWTHDDRSAEIVELGLGPLASRYLSALPAAPAADIQQHILTMIAAAERSVPGLLRRVSVPTLLLWGQQDRVEPLDRALFLHRRMPRTSLRVFSGSGHLLTWERAEEVANVTARFLALA